MYLQSSNHSMDGNCVMTMMCSVTLAFDSVESAKMKDVVDSMDVPAQTVPEDTIGVGVVGT